MKGRDAIMYWCVKYYKSEGLSLSLVGEQSVPVLAFFGHSPLSMASSVNARPGHLFRGYTVVAIGLIFRNLYTSVRSCEVPWSMRISPGTPMGKK